MTMTAKVLAALAGLFHVLFFAMESFLWRTPRVMKIFQQTSESVELTARMAYNQGFYNLFLALGIFAGLFMMRSPEQEKQGLAVVVFALLSMFGASIILVLSTGKVLGMAIQGAPPVLALALFWLSRSSK